MSSTILLFKLVASHVDWGSRPAALHLDRGLSWPSTSYFTPSINQKHFSFRPTMMSKSPLHGRKKTGRLARQPGCPIHYTVKRQAGHAIISPSPLNFLSSKARALLAAPRRIYRYDPENHELVADLAQEPILEQHAACDQWRHGVSLWAGHTADFAIVPLGSINTIIAELRHQGNQVCRAVDHDVDGFEITPPVPARPRGKGRHLVKVARPADRADIAVRICRAEPDLPIVVVVASRSRLVTLQRQLQDGSGRLAQVHLTWTQCAPETLPWPDTVVYRTFEEWAVEMRRDHGGLG